MNEKELREFRAILQKRGQLVQKLKKTAGELLDSLGLLTPTGKLKRKFMPPKATSVSSPTIRK